MNYEEFKAKLCPAILCREEVVGKHVCIAPDDILYITDYNYPEHKIWLKTEYLYECCLCGGLGYVVEEVVCRLQTDKFLRECSPVMRPLNYAGNQAELQDAIYQRMGDITLVLYTVWYENNSQSVTEKLSRSTVAKWGISEARMFTEALIVTSRVRPPRLYHGSDMGWMGCPDGGVFMPKEKGRCIEIHNQDKEEGKRGYRLTALGYENGAVALFYPGVQEQLAGLLGGDYYVGFISVHEAVIHPARYKVLGDMRKAVVRANIMRAEKERLTDRIYRYCCNGKGLVEV